MARRAIQPCRLTPGPYFLTVEFFEKGKFSSIAADYVGALQEKLRIIIDIREVDSWSVATPEREKYMLLFAPYIKSSVVIIIGDDIKAALDISKLKGLKVAAIRNYAIGALLRQAHPR